MRTPLNFTSLNYRLFSEECQLSIGFFRNDVDMCLTLFRNMSIHFAVFPETTKYIFAKKSPPYRFPVRRGLYIGYIAVYPPSTASITPFTYDDAGDARKITAESSSPSWP